MTDELDLDAIEALANAATPGPWVVSTDLWDGMPVGSMLTGYSQDKQQDYSVHIVGKSPPDDISDAATDAAFIAAARAVVPALVAEVRRLRGIYAQVTEELQMALDELKEAKKECIARRDNFEVMVKRLIEAENENKRLQAALEKIAVFDGLTVEGEMAAQVLRGGQA